MVWMRRNSASRSIRMLRARTCTHSSSIGLFWSSRDAAISRTTFTPVAAMRTQISSALTLLGVHTSTRPGSVAREPSRG